MLRSLPPCSSSALRSFASHPSAGASPVLLPLLLCPCPPWSSLLLLLLDCPASALPACACHPLAVASPALLSLQYTVLPNAGCNLPKLQNNPISKGFSTGVVYGNNYNLKKNIYIYQLVYIYIYIHIRIGFWCIVYYPFIFSGLLAFASHPCTGASPAQLSLPAPLAP